MRTQICDTCLKIVSRCQCEPERKKKRLPLCEYKDARGCPCGKEYRFTIPVPGTSPDKTPSQGSLQWQRLCEDHYAYERPEQWHDERLQAAKEALEAKHGKFSDHAGKDMAQHCLSIMYNLGGAGAKIAQMLSKGIDNEKTKAPKADDAPPHDDWELVGSIPSYPIEGEWY